MRSPGIRILAELGAEGTERGETEIPNKWAIPESCPEFAWTKQATKQGDYFFFLWRFLRNLFLRLWVAILWRLRFFPQGMAVRLKG
jgi:hypothetical protein